MAGDLRSRIRAKELLIGSFVKTPAPHNVEILGYSGLDFAVVDQEHAPIDISQMDMMVLAGRAVGLPLLARRWGQSTDWVAPLLDLGVLGVMVPHVLDGGGAEQVCDAVRFSRGKRGLSPSPRAGGYGGMTLDAYRADADAKSIAVVQIEDESALAKLPEICAVEGVDMLFIGPADLSQSMRVDMGSDALDNAIQMIIDAGKAADIAVGIYVGNVEAIPKWRDRGVSVFVCGSDQSMLRQSATRLMGMFGMAV